MTLETQETMTIGETITRFLVQLNGTPESKFQCQQDINRFARWLGHSRTWASITSHEIASYADTMGTTTTDAIKKLDSVKGLLAYAKKTGATPTNLGTNLRPKKAPLRSARSQTFKPAQEEPAYLTDEGYQSLMAELNTQKAERPKIAEALRAAMADKDFRENAPLDAAKDQQAHVEARIRELEALMKQAEVMQRDRPQARRAALGSTVTLVDQSDGGEMQFILVHPHEANPVQGKVSVASPTGKAVLGRAAGEEVSVTAPAGVLQYRIEAIEPGA